MKPAYLVAMGILLLLALLVVQRGPVLSGVLRNAGSISFVQFALEQGDERWQRLDKAAMYLEGSLQLKRDMTLQNRLAAMQGLQERYTVALASDTTAHYQQDDSDCTEAPVQPEFLVNRVDAELGDQIRVQIASCGMGFTRNITLTNLVWIGEDIRLFAESELFGFSSGRRTKELEGLVANRFALHERNGVDATVIAMENLSDTDNVLLSWTVPVQGGSDYYLGGWINSLSGIPNAWFGIVCRDSMGSRDERYFYIARNYATDGWHYVHDVLSLDAGLAHCNVLLLNYGPPETILFDEIVFGQLPQGWNQE